MRSILVITFFCASILYLHGQTPVGSWSDHLVYNTASAVCTGSSEVFASTGSSVLVYNKEYDEIRKMSRINGLTESGISTLSWSEENKTLVIAYSSTNIDLVKNNTIYNIPDISRKYIPGKKEVTRIRIKGNYAYLACSFGIVVLDIVRKEILDTWRPGSGNGTTEIWDLALGDGKIYAATGAGVYFGDLSNTGLAYFGNWQLIGNFPFPFGKYTSIVYAGNKLYANLSVKNSGGDSVYRFDGTADLFSYIPGVFNSSFDPAAEGFTITSPVSVRKYNNEGSLIKTISSTEWPNPQFSQAVADNGDIWIADKISGLIRSRDNSELSTLTVPGPYSNNAFHISSGNGKTIICAGGADVSWNNLGRTLQISIHENNGWTNLTPAKMMDGMRTLIDPDDVNRFFISTWGRGLLEYRDTTLVKQYKDSNSPLQTIIPGRPYVRICGLAMDKEKILWMTQSEVPGTIKALKPDGTWIVNPITVDVPSVGDIIVTQNGHKWVILPRGNGLFVLDDNNTHEVFGDDRSKRMLIEDQEKTIISQIYSIAEDMDGNIWVGTDQGPLIYYNPENVFDSDLKAFRIKVPRNDGTDYYNPLLKSETITSITVDGANRKWLGTNSSGAYLVSPDGTVQIRNYNEENSPILSNSIVSMAIDNKSGDVWFGTARGIQSVRGDAVKGEDVFTKVYAFPNPVREDFNGNVTIAGLMRDSRVKITDISGNLVFETESAGGEASWDLKTFNGQRVATGVYLVFCASKDGTQSYVTKMLVIKQR